jgi:hypothetical protein
MKVIKILFNKFLFIINKRQAVIRILREIRIKGKIINVDAYIQLKRARYLLLGNNVRLKGGGDIDASGGVMIGDGCVIERNVNISSVEVEREKTYSPVVIGSGNILFDDVVPGTVMPNRISSLGLSGCTNGLIFVVSTGRSGSKAIVELLNQHPTIDAYHDCFPHINSWSAEYLYNNVSSKIIEERLSILFNSFSINHELVHCQSDQKLAPLIKILADLYPHAKFLWLIRNAKSFVNSSYSRGWFYNSEFNYIDNALEFCEANKSPSHYYAYHRANGHRIGEVDEDVWRNMTAFERNCWYWSYWNSLIEGQLNNISEERWIIVKLEELDECQSRILEFLEVSMKNLNAKIVNQATYKKNDIKSWSSDMERIFKNHCEELMLKWYK